MCTMQWSVLYDEWLHEKVVLLVFKDVLIIVQLTDDECHIWSNDLKFTTINVIYRMTNGFNE